MSDLHNRLTHLVNYSSQLIFVSGDSINDQQRTLNAFLSSQQENTEISYFSASTSKQDSDYRGAICRQLGGHTVGSFIRPLPILLNDPVDGLSAQNGPYLLCITQAELLTKAFLQELWDWVMHSQQGENKVHLNIILFGESSWAKQSQQWLPSQNSHKPVLLSSACVDPVGFDVNALEALMADKHSWFSTSNQPLVANKWFISGVLSVFFIVFTGLMAWQYPAQVESIFAGSVESEEVSAPQSAKPSLRAKDEVLNAVEPEVEKSSDAQKISINESNYTSQLEVISAMVPKPLLQKTQANQQSIANNLLVSSWSNSSSGRIDSKTALPLQSILEDEKEVEQEFNSPNNNSLNKTNFSDSLQNIQTPNSTHNLLTTDGDFQVPDIISVEQLDEQLSTIQETSFESEQLGEFLTVNTPNDKINLNNSISKSTIAPTEQQISTQNDSTIDYKFDETTLLSLPSDSVMLQLSGIQNPEVLENYLSNNNLKASTWVYETQRYGGSWYVVLYRQSFESIDAALNQLSSLPADLREAQPFAKSISQIQQEINRR